MMSPCRGKGYYLMSRQNGESPLRVFIDGFWISHGQAFKAHDFQGVRRGAGACPQFEVEGHSAIFDGFAKVHVADALYFFFEVDQFQIVGGDQPKAVSACEGLDEGSAADEAFAVVCAPEYFIDEEEQGEVVF